MTNYFAKRSRRVRVQRTRVRRAAYRAKASANRARVNAHNAKVLASWDSGGRKFRYRSGIQKPSLCQAVIELKKVTEESVAWSDDQHPRDLVLHPSMLVEQNSLTYKSIFIKSGGAVSGKRRIFQMSFGGRISFLEEKKIDPYGPFKFLDKNEVEIKLDQVSKENDNFCFIIPCKSSFEITTLNEFDRKKLTEDLYKRIMISSYNPKSTTKKTSSQPKEGKKEEEEEEETKDQKEGRDDEHRSKIIFCIIFRESHNNKKSWRVMGFPSKLGIENKGFEDLYVTDDLPYYEKTIQRILSVIDENEAVQKRFLQSFKRIEKETKEITDKYEEYVNYFKELGKRKKGRIHLDCRADGLDKMDSFLGLSDPYFRIRVDGSEEEENWYFKSEIIKRNLEPNWEASTCKKVVKKLHKRHRLEVMDWNKIGKDKLIGYFTFIPQKVFKKNKKVGYYGRKKKVRFYISRFQDLSINKNKHLSSGIFFFEQFVIFSGKNNKDEVIRKYDELEKMKFAYDSAKSIGEDIRFKKVLIGEKKEEKEEEEEEEEGEEEKKDDDDEEESEEESNESDSTDNSEKEESD